MTEAGTIMMFFRECAADGTLHLPVFWFGGTFPYDQACFSYSEI